MPWEHFSHDADIGVRGIGHSLNEAFEMAGLALTGIIINPKEIPQKFHVQVKCQAPNHEILLVDWLNAIIFEMDTRQILFSYFKVSINENALDGLLVGQHIHFINAELGVDLKGATYTELMVKQNNQHWLAQCVIDV